MTSPSNSTPFRDSLYRLAQAGEARGMQLVKITALDTANRYTAQPVEFAQSGSLQPTDDDPITITNLAEPADASGTISADTAAVALDIEGRWIVFVRPPSTGAAGLVAKVVASLGSAAYSLREQVPVATGGFVDKTDAPLLTASNLAELSLGDGAALDAGALVVLTDLSGRYVFDHPLYAKYLD